MQKYFINKEEVDQEEFEAELRAEAHAFLDENFDGVLEKFSDNYEETFFVGHYEFDVIELFKVLPQEMQEDISKFLLKSLNEEYFDILDFDGYVDVDLEQESIHFEVKEIDEE